MDKNKKPLINNGTNSHNSEPAGFATIGNAVDLSGVAFHYPQEKTVLKDVNLTISQGERVGLIGPNGAGKTTLLLILCGVLAPTSGQVVLFRQPVEPGSFRPDVGYVWQNSDDQLFCPSVRDDIAFGPRNMGLSPAEVENRVRSACRVTGIESLLDRPPHHLSGGEKQMVAIAGILAMGSPLLIFDEPTASLDLAHRRRLIRFLQASVDKTQLIASHDLEFLLEVCTQVILLDQGRIIAQGDPAQIMSNKELMESHQLEVPPSLK